MTVEIPSWPPLQAHRDRVLRRIDAVQNRDEDWFMARPERTSAVRRADQAEQEWCFDQTTEPVTHVRVRLEDGIMNFGHRSVKTTEFRWDAF